MWNISKMTVFNRLLVRSAFQKKNTMWNIVLVLTFSFCYIIYTGTPIASPFVMSYDITTDNNSRALRHNKRIKTSDKNMKQARKTLLPQMCKYANQAEA